MIYYQTENGTLHQGDVLDVLRALPSESVHMVVTSPPYWGLRDYGIEPQIWDGHLKCKHEWGNCIIKSNSGGGWSDPDDEEKRCSYGMRTKEISKIQSKKVSQGVFCQKCGAWKGSLGLEPTPELYVKHIVQIMGEVKRVLRNDGTLWLNIGDSYASTGKNRSIDQAIAKSTLRSPSRGQISILKQQNKVISGFKTKDLIGIPWRVAFALQADGWCLRQDIIWHKPNPMPESVTDRCGKAHDYIFLLVKSKKYFYDNEAIREPQTGLAHGRGRGITPKTAENGLLIKANKAFHKSTSQYTVIPGGRNKRSVWTMITQAFPGAHFATFPEELPRTCILAGTSQKGCCPECGRPWERILEKESIIKPIGYDGKWSQAGPQSSGRKIGANSRARRELGDRDHSNPFSIPKTIGWRPGRGCKCHLESTEPCIVLDPFGGAGTTGLVAEKLGRKWILIELSEAYCKISKKRIEPYTKQFKMKFA